MRAGFCPTERLPHWPIMCVVRMCVSARSLTMSRRLSVSSPPPPLPRVLRGACATFRCLIKPVQRLTKYPLFFKDLLAHLPHDHVARDSLESAEALVLQVSHAVNQDVADEVNGIRT